MAKSRPRSLLKVLGCLLVLGLLVGALVLGAALMQSSMEVTHDQSTDAQRELDAIIARFGGSRPYMDLERRDGVLVAVVHHELEPATPARIATVGGLYWDAPGGRLVRASTPFWVFTVTRWKTRGAARLVEPLEQRLGLDVQLPDLSPFGPGLVLDHRVADGRRIVVWTEGD